MRRSTPLDWQRRLPEPLFYKPTFVLYADLNGVVYLLGYPGYPTKMVSTPGTTGEKTADAKGRTYSFQSVGSGPALRFTGKVLAGVVE